VREAEDGVVLATNFYASGKIEHARRPEWLQESRDRFDAIKGVLAGTAGTALDKASAALKAHDQRGSVCRHNVLGFHTVLSFAAVLREGQFRLCKGYPCTHEYHVHQL